LSRKIVANLAIGTKFLQMALGCMKSAQRICGQRYTYVIFYAWCDIKKFDVPSFITLVNIEPIITGRKTRGLYNDEYRVISAEEIRSDGFAAREIKGIPFIHPDFVDDDMIFLDADVIVYDDCFEELFVKTRAQSVVTLGGALDPTVASYNWPHAGWEFNLREQARLVGFDVVNRRVHTGIVGRGSDNVAKHIAITFDYLLQAKPLPLFPANVRYFNDEAYFALALSLATARFPGRNFHTLTGLDFMKTTAKKTFLGVDPISGKPILGNPDNPDQRDSDYAILHFHTVATWDADFYQKWLDKNVPIKATLPRPARQFDGEVA
jgi:hypothetical protein